MLGVSQFWEIFIVLIQQTGTILKPAAHLSSDLSGNGHSISWDVLRRLTPGASGSLLLTSCRCLIRLANGELSGQLLLSPSCIFMTLLHVVNFAYALSQFVLHPGCCCSLISVPNLIRPWQMGCLSYHSVLYNTDWGLQGTYWCMKMNRVKNRTNMEKAVFR